jgi:hypothetical protein
MLVWRIYNPGNNETYLDHHTKCQILTKFGFYQQIFVKLSNMKFHGNPSSGRRADT